MRDDRFIQPLDGIELVYQSESGTLLTPETLQRGRDRVALGESIEDVSLDLALDEIMLLDGLDVDDVDDVDLRDLGGVGSGNFGHAGRPGERGGSQKHFTARTFKDTSETSDYAPIVEDEQGNEVSLNSMIESRSDLPEAQHNAVHNYVLNNYGALNRSLRQVPSTPNWKGEVDQPEPEGTYAEQIKHLDAAISDTYDEPLTVYRAVNAGVIPREVGSRFTDKGYASTTMAENVAGLHSQMQLNYGQLWDIEVPAGQKFFDVTKHFHADSDTNDEQELILPRGTIFEVTGPYSLKVVKA